MDQVVDKTEPSYLLVNPQVNNSVPPVPSCYGPEGMFRSPVAASLLFLWGDLPWVQHELAQDCNFTKCGHSELSSSLSQRSLDWIKPWLVAAPFPPKLGGCAGIATLSLLGRNRDPCRLPCSHGSQSRPQAPLLNNSFHGFSMAAAG